MLLILYYILFLIASQEFEIFCEQVKWDCGSRNKIKKEHISVFLLMVTRTGNRRHCRFRVLPLRASQNSLNGCFGAAIPHKARSPRSKLCLRHRATMRLGRERAAARGSRNKIKKGTHFCVPSCGDPDGNRTRVTAVKGRCLSRLTTGPKLRQLCFVAVVAEVGFEPTTFRV